MVSLAFTMVVSPLIKPWFVISVWLVICVWLPLVMIPACVLSMWLAFSVNVWPAVNWLWLISLPLVVNAKRLATSLSWSVWVWSTCCVMAIASAWMAPPFCNSLAVISACLTALMMPSWLMILSLATSVISVPLVRLPPVLMMAASLPITMPFLAVMLPLVLSKLVNCQLISSKAILLSVLVRVLVFRLCASMDACLVLLVWLAVMIISPVAVMSARSPVLLILLVAMI